jgi:hypothetical protein
MSYGRVERRDNVGISIIYRWLEYGLGLLSMSSVPARESFQLPGHSISWAITPLTGARLGLRSWCHPLPWKQVPVQTEGNPQGRDEETE